MLQGNRVTKSGIETIGDIAWGTHISHMYSSKEEFGEVLAPYIKEGLLNNQLCIWIYSPNISRREIIGLINKTGMHTEAYISSGQLILIPYTQWYIKNGVFDEARVIDQWLELVKQARAGGYEGLRAVGDTYWLEHYTEEFSNYEKKINTFISKLPLSVICAYDMNNIEIFEFDDIIRNHSLSILKSNNYLHVFKNSAFDISRKTISEKRFQKSQMQLEQKERLLFEILDSSTIGTYMIDYKKGNIIYSDQWIKRLGLENVEPDKLLKYTYARIIPEDLKRSAESRNALALSQKTITQPNFALRINTII